MLKLRCISLAFLCLFSVSACSSDTTPTDEEVNFAVNEDIKKNDALCFPLGGEYAIEQVSFPKIEFAAARWQQYDAFIKAGLVEVSDTKGVPEGYSREVFARKFDLTTDGRKYFKDFTAGYRNRKGFCYAENSLEKITSVSEPKVDPFGISSVVVNYSLQTKEYPWFENNKDALFSSNAHIKKFVDSVKIKYIGESKLYLTKTGWKHPDFAPRSELVREETSQAEAVLDFATGSKPDDGIGAKLQRLILGF